MASRSYYYNRIVPWRTTGVHLAAYFGLKEATIALLENGHGLNFKDSDNRTPLLWAAEYGREAVVKLLLEKGAELETKGKEYGRTPLLWAAGNGHEAVVKLLLEKGAKNPNDSYLRNLHIIYHINFIIITLTERVLGELMFIYYGILPPGVSSMF